MRFLRGRLGLRGVIVAGVAAGLLFVVAPAAFANYIDPFEFERWTGQGDGIFSLTSLGTGCIFKRESCQCDWTDHRFRINVNRSSNRRDWKLWSGNSRYQRNPTGRPIYGFSLENSNAHVCIGSREFSSREFPDKYWTDSGVAQYLYTWRR